MKKDIQIHAVKDVLIALVPEEISENTIWRAVIINLKDSEIDTVLINAEAKGMVHGEEKHTDRKSTRLNSSHSSVSRMPSSA